MLRARTCIGIAFGFLLASPVLLAQTAPQVTAAPAPAASGYAKPKHHQAHKAPPPLVLPPLPAGPLSQVPMDLLPETPAKVTYQGGLLTISAQNSSLGEILRDVRKLTGASIEIPPHTNERVVAHLGPGAPRDVLAQLLNGSSFNYVMLGSNSDPAAVSSVILTARPSASGDTATAALHQNNPAGMPPNRFPPPGQPPNAQAVEADDSSDEPENSDENADDNADEQPQPAQPAANVQDQRQQPDPNQPNAGPRTPEQILEMLQRQRQQPGSPAVPPQPQQ